MLNLVRLLTIFGSAGGSYCHDPCSSHDLPTLRLLDRYIFKEVLFSCFAAVAFFTSIVWAANALKDLLSLILSGQLPIESAIGLFVLAMVSAVMYALPMGILCGVLIVLGRLSAQGEIIAMRANGISLFRIGLPVYALAAAGVLGALVVNLYLMPRAEVTYQREFADLVRTDPLKLIVPRTFIRDFRGVVVFVNEKKGAILRDLWVWELDREQRVTCLDRAESGRLDLDEEHNAIVLTPSNGWREMRNPKDPEDFSLPLNELTWETTGIRFPLEKLFGRKTSRHKVDWLTWVELQSELVRLSQPGDPTSEKQRATDRMKVQLVIQDKLTAAFAIFAFAMVAVPLGIKVSRSETSANLGVALMLILAYYFLTVVIKWIHSPDLRPDLLLWVPNLIFVVVGLWLHRRAALA